jgi:hypothetical protein
MPVFVLDIEGLELLGLSLATPRIDRGAMAPRANAPGCLLRNRDHHAASSDRYLTTKASARAIELFA